MKNTSTKNRISASEQSQVAESESASTAASEWLENTMESVEAYARREPWSFGLCMLGVGFVLGWKLKIW